MMDGGVSIAVRSVYPGKQVRIRSSKVRRREQSSIGMSSNRIRRSPVGELVWRHFTIKSTRRFRWRSDIVWNDFGCKTRGTMGNACDIGHCLLVGGRILGS